MAARVPELSGEPDRRSVRAAVLGSPISHSLSPVLHRAAYDALGLTWWHYDAIECDEAGLPALLDRCGPDWVGLSLTMPLKRTVLPLLDRVESLATSIGSANTIVFAAAQRLGYNTDVPGMVSALVERGIGRGTGQAGPALVIGGGATARSALAALATMGEKSVAVAVRNPAAATGLLAAAEQVGISVTLRPFETSALQGMRLVISTVPAGVADFFGEILPGNISGPEAVLDVVYHPWPTKLALAASAAGAVVVSGFDLLVHQAVRQVELMTDRPAPLEEMRRAGHAELDGRRSG